jgi:Alkaline and neutral invertase
MRSLIDDCVREAHALLGENLAPAGILAAGGGAARGYANVFARDASVCALAMAGSGDARLEDGAAASLVTLAGHQAENGQIPKLVDARAGKADFWYVGCIDATLWWLVALDWVARRGAARGLGRRLAPNARRALAWVSCQEHPGIALVSQNEASDWADIMPRSGFVLYTNALWYHVKCLYGLPGAALTRRNFNHLFRPTARDLPEYRRLRLLAHYARRHDANPEMYLGYVNLGAAGDEGDVFGNLLAVLLGLADGARAKAVLRAIERAQAGAAYPVRSVCTPIAKGDARWRVYMGRHRQNLEHQYHNGGIWPMLGGFWVAALAAQGMQAKAEEELVRLAGANAANGWQFNEWFHGLTGKPSGMPRQSWNAAAFLLAARSLEKKLF